MIARVISGGQTGVDIAALRAARACGIATGGTMPKGFLTLDGPKPEWAQEFGLAEHDLPTYPPRTRQNVRDADITIQIARDLKSPGEKCTANAVRDENALRSLIVLHADLAPIDDDIRAAIARMQMLRQRLKRDLVVNFAGNSEERVPGIERAAEGIVQRILTAGGAS